MGESCADLLVLKPISINRALTRKVKEGGTLRGSCGGAWNERRQRRAGREETVWQEEEEIREGRYKSIDRLISWRWTGTKGWRKLEGQSGEEGLVEYLKVNSTSTHVGFLWFKPPWGKTQLSGAIVHTDTAAEPAGE